MIDAPFLVIALVIGAFVLLSIFFHFVPFFLWISAKVSGVHISLLQRYEMQGREVIIHDIANSDITERARQSAANAIVPILRQLGYKPQNITISFRKKFTPADVEGIISSSSVENKGNAARR